MQPFIVSSTSAAAAAAASGDHPSPANMGVSTSGVMTSRITCSPTSGVCQSWAVSCQT